MVTRTNFAAPKPKMLRIDMEDALCRRTLSPRRPWIRMLVDPPRRDHHQAQETVILPTGFLHARGVVYIARELVDR